MRHQIFLRQWACLITLVLSAGFASQVLAALPLDTAKTQRKSAEYVYINSEKYQVLARHQYHWSLYDLNKSQPVLLLNQLTVTGVGSVADLKKRINLSKEIKAEQIARDVLVLSGPVTLLMQLQQQLRCIVAVRSEWQLRYLPVKSAADR